MSTAAVPPMGDPRARAARTKRDRTRRALLDAADSAFGSRGWARTRVEDIAQSAGRQRGHRVQPLPDQARPARAGLRADHQPVARCRPARTSRRAGRSSEALSDQVRALCRLCARNRILTSAFFAAASEYTIKIGALPDPDDDADPRTLVPMTEALELLIGYGQASGELRPYPSARDLSGLLVNTVLIRNVNRPGESPRHHRRAVTHRDVRSAAAQRYSPAPSGRSPLLAEPFGRRGRAELPNQAPSGRPNAPNWVRRSRHRRALRPRRSARARRPARRRRGRAPRG